MKIGFIGAGNMGRAIIDGWLKQQAVVPADIYIHSAHAASYQPYAQKMGYRPVTLIWPWHKLLTLSFWQLSRTLRWPH